jgi:predicted HicB family RNase H-like nuclease
VARIHYEIPDQLHRQAKAKAALLGMTLKEFVIAALRAAVLDSPDTTDD